MPLVAATEVNLSDRLEIISKFSIGSAHDIGNQLAVIMGYCDVLERNAVPDSRSSTAVKNMRHAVQNIHTLSQQLLAWTTNYEPKLIRTDVNALLCDNERTLASILGFFVTFNVTLTPDLPPIMADPAWLIRAISNLVTNAGNALRNVPTGGKKEVEISTFAVDDGVEICVRDSGSGMTPETRLRILAGESFTLKGGHIGMGLGIVRTVVEMMNGKLTLLSELGVGTTFIIWATSADTIRRGELPELIPIATPLEPLPAA
jgi:signal transduction histidine kinase